MSTSDELDEDFSPESYRTRLDNLMQMRNRLKSVSASATAPRKVVSVTVGNGGELTDLSFPTNAYKTMSRTELAATILRTVAEARTKAMQQSAETLGPILPAGVDFDHLVDGTVEMKDLLPEGISLPPHLAEFFEGRPGGSTGR
ncbi:YbaB/EbfC family nucleoid-associated protein [Pseudonocardia xinjiangensis]|jgi:hypothetical protein|uniref:YbaB/EbfC family nucleoid-associated protein n=1 Tax=Pseudonocardia xinjiangensis TaxID=75289 RepID=A0ABX1RPY8_9PSEU|nr:YbaB/EbfC family nucleoid-associated protein [Pseudonocardia xinjiangensis]NMH82438.1 YbaB/EbfC family nucleoid-associated protein [Pseudonocardia xinjiangensis]